MYFIGDIGNTETKICLFNSEKKLILKRVFNTNEIKATNINRKLSFLKTYKKKFYKVIFSSVVPTSFKILKIYLEKKYKLTVKELKQYNLKKILKVDVNMRQIGSDRLANAIGVIDYKRNFIVLDFGTATTFDVIDKD